VASYRYRFSFILLLTNRRKLPSSIAKTKGPARSVSSIMCGSTGFIGCITVTVFFMMWSKLIPSSLRVRRVECQRNFTKEYTKPLRLESQSTNEQVTHPRQTKEWREGVAWLTFQEWWFIVKASCCYRVKTCDVGLIARRYWWRVCGWRVPLMRNVMWRISRCKLHKPQVST